jgi:hypothetical protein
MLLVKIVEEPLHIQQRNCRSSSSVNFCCLFFEHSSESHTNTTGVYRRHQQHQQAARKQRAQLTALIDHLLQISIEELTIVEADMIEKCRIRLLNRTNE